MPLINVLFCFLTPAASNRDDRPEGVHHEGGAAHLPHTLRQTKHL